MAAVQSADVSFWVMLVDPRVDGLGAPMLELNLQQVTIVSNAC